MLTPLTARASGPEDRLIVANHHPWAGRFIVLDLVGKGGMGAVYVAYDPALRREVALKVISAEAQESGTNLVHEAQAMAKLSHPNIVAIYDVIVSGPQIVLAMEYVAGPTLGVWLGAQQGLHRAPHEVVAAFVQAGRGLSAAHQVGLIHRDFKPANVLVAEDGRVLVTDFGIAEERRVSDGDVVRPASEGGAATEVDLICGTPKYMSPEQHAGRPLDGRSDQYAFCIALWEALCGTTPFAASSTESLEYAKLRGPPPWPKSQGIPAPIANAIRRGLAPQPEQRWATMSELLQALEHGLRARRRHWAAGAVVLPVVGAWLWTWHGERAALCAGAAEHVRDVWDEAQRSAVREALLGSGLSYAPATWTRVDTELQRYVSAWEAQHRSACEASLHGAEGAAVMDLRMGCLHRRKVQLQSTVDMLVRADAQIVERAVQMISGLPALHRCADVAALQAEVEPPDDPGDAATVDRARTLLAEASVQEKAGRYADALATVVAAEATVRGVDYPPIHAEIALRRGSILDFKGNFHESEAALAEALDVALRSGMMGAVAEATTHLAVSLGAQERHLDTGVRLARFAVALTSAPGENTASAADAANALGIALMMRGRVAEAGAAFERTLRLVQESFGDNDPRVFGARRNLATVMLEQDRPQDAEAELRQGLTAIEAAFGPEHPDVANYRINLAIALNQQGRAREAEEEHRRALSIRERALGEDHPSVADSHQGLARTLINQGRNGEAEREVRRALALRERAFGPEHRLVADCQFVLGHLLHLDGQHVAAEHELARALVTYEKTLPPDDYDLAALRQAIAAVRSETPPRAAVVED